MQHKIGKQVHSSHYSKNVENFKKILELFHRDLFDSSLIQSYGENFNTLVVVDDFSIFTWTLFLKIKCETFETKDAKNLT